MRLDLAQNTWAWRKGFDCSGCTIEIVTGLGVDPSATTVVAYATRQNDKYADTGYILVVRA